MNPTMAGLIWAILSFFFALTMADLQMAAHPLPLMLLFFCFMFSNYSLGRAIADPDRVSPLTILFWIYFAYLLILPGIAQLSREDFFWTTGREYRESAIALAAVVLGIFLVVFRLGQILGGRFETGRLSTEAIVALDRRHFLLIFTFAIGAALFGAYSFVSLGPAFFIGSRGTVGEAVREVYDISQSGMLVLLPRYLIFTGFALSIHVFQQLRGQPMSLTKAASVCLILLLFGLNALMNSPLALARFVFFGMMIILIMSFFPPATPRKRLAYVLTFLFGLYTLFPLIQQFNRYEFNYDIELPDLAEYLQHGDFDGFQSMINTVEYTMDEGHEWGRQLASSALFFVPRAIWPGKAEHTGYVTSDHVGYNYFNISAPAPAELWIDFGLFGVVFGGILLGMGIARLDQLYTQSMLAGRSSLVRIFVAAFCGFIIILLRGPLLGVIGPVAIIISIMLLMRILPGIISSLGITTTAPPGPPPLRRIGSAAPPRDVGPHPAE